MKLSCRNIQITLNEVEKWDELRDYIQSLKSFQYGLATLEKAPTTGHKHIHFYVQFKEAIKIPVKKLLGAHVEKCRGSAQENIEYIRKTKQPEKAGEIIFEKGEPKLKGGKTIKEVKEMPREERENLPLVYYNIVNKINQQEMATLKGNEMHKDMKVFWYYGPSGLGKTKKAYEQIGDRKFNEVKFDGNFWHGVNDETTIALYDDFRSSDMKPRELINFIDYNKHIMNVKGGSHRNNYTEIYITSIESPEEIYQNVQGEPRKQWLRRITEIIQFSE